MKSEHTFFESLLPHTESR